MKKLSILCLIILVLGLTSFSVMAENQETIKIGFTVIDQNMGYWNDQLRGAQAKADELGIELITNNADSDPTKQITAIENWIIQDVDAMIISAVDAKICEEYIERAHEKDIPVVAAIHSLEGADASVIQDEYRLGYMTGEIAGKWIKNNLKDNAKFAVLGFDALEHVIVRGDGMEDGVYEQAPEANLVARQDCDGLANVGMSVAESLLQAHPDLQVFVCVNDAGALGVVQAIRSAGKNTEEVCVVGSDRTEEAIEQIKKGTIFRGTIDLNPYGAGQLEVEKAYKLINNIELTRHEIAPMKAILYEESE